MLTDTWWAAHAGHLAPATQRMYRWLYDRWARYADQQQSPACPADALVVAAHIDHLAQRRCRPATIQLTVTAINAVHRWQDHRPPGQRSVVQRALQRATRQLGAGQRQRTGLSSADVALITRTAQRQGPGQPPTLRDVALIQLMHDALLRPAEAAGLCWGDLQEHTHTLQLRHSKTDQTGQGTALFVSPRTLATMVPLRPPGTPPAAAIFGITPRQINRRIALAAAAAGLVGDYGGHSPRVGMAQELVRQGATLPEVMQAGRWRSPAMVARYTAHEAAGQGAVARLYRRRGRRR